jgi:hypothetical protein
MGALRIAWSFWGTSAATAREVSLCGVRFIWRSGPWGGVRAFNGKWARLETCAVRIGAIVDGGNGSLVSFLLSTCLWLLIFCQANCQTQD